MIMTKAEEYFKEWSIDCRILKNYNPIHDHKDMLSFAESYHASQTEWISVEDRLPDYQFKNKATKYIEQGQMVLAVDTDGISLTNDNLPHQAYTLEEGVEYLITIHKIAP